MTRAPRKRVTAFVRSGDAPLYRQIYEHIRTAISAGQIKPGGRLPSARRLADEFATARGTVDAAYAMLAGEGYVVARGPAGTIVSSDLAGARMLGTEARARLAADGGQQGLYEPKPFQMGLPALDAFPRKIWSRLVAREARALSPSDMAYPDPAGFWPLRQAISGYLATSRGIVCTPAQVIITRGYQGALRLALDLTIKRGERVWLEDPCYPLTRDTIEAAGAKLVPIRVDAQGLRVPDGRARARRARLAVVTPSHQSPLGVSLSLPRRLALLAWAADAKAFVVEDDYDSEFRYVGRPLPALKSMDRDDRVLYVGTFSKVLYPGLRLGYLVVPEKLIFAFTRANLFDNSGASSLEQRVVAAFISEGHFARHIKQMRNLYAARRQALAGALADVFGDDIEVDLAAGGMHLIFRPAGRISDVELTRRLRATGLAAEALSSRALAHPSKQALLLGFTNIAESDADNMCRRLRRAIGSLS
jgi:GntR family transcriptional regulator/MocR family aminotransferase